MIVQSNQTIFDISILLEGKLDNMVKDIMIKYQLVDLQNDYTGKNIDVIFNTTNNNVRYFYNQDLNIETFDNQIYQEFIEGTLGEFDNDEYDEDYDI